MQSLFKSRTKSKKTSSSAQSSPDQPKRLAPSKSLPSLANSAGVCAPVVPPTPSSPSIRIDEFGRPLANPPPAFTFASHRHAAASPTRPTLGPEMELQLLYGYTGLYTEVELDLPTTTHIVNVVARQLKASALDTPLLFSTHALDISVEGTHSLIRSFVNNHRDFSRDLQLAGAHNLSAFLKWVLARHVNSQGLHGFLKWDQYVNWREAEKESDYPPRFIATHLLSLVPSNTAALLSCLLDLFSTASAYSHSNGMTVHKCGAIFGAFIFGLEDDQPFEKTYSAWLRYSHATEHLILAYLRDQKATSATGELPSRMEASIKGYPQVIPSLNKTHPSARLEYVGRFRRYARFYNKNLIFNASSWQVERSKTWDRLLPYPSISTSQVPTSQQFTAGQSKPVFTKSYQHLLNIGNDFDFESEIANGEPDFEVQQRFKTMVEKEWSGFMNKGFDEPDTKKLEFDLTESERTRRQQKHGTMDWESFAGSGFVGRETYVPTDLQFNTDFSATVNTWQSDKKTLTRKLIKTNRALPPFPYNIVPVEEAPLYIDDNFFEAWVDVLIASGWSRDEFKEVSWGLVHYKCKPSNHLDVEFQPTSANHDGRIDDMWVLFEEVVPPEYREELIQNGQKISNALNKKGQLGTLFLRSMTRKDNKKTQGSVTDKMSRVGDATFEYVTPAHSRHVSRGTASVHSSHYTITPTRAQSLARSLTQSEYHPSSLAPSIGHGHQSGDLVNPSAPPSPTAQSIRQPTGSSGSGFMADLRAKAKRRHAGYNVPPPVPPLSVPSPPAPVVNRPAAFESFDHDTHSIMEDHDTSHLKGRGKKGREPWVNVLVGSAPLESAHSTPPESVHSAGETFEEVPRQVHGSSRGSSEETPNYDRPMNPTPGSSRAMTPNTDPEGSSLEDSPKVDASRHKEIRIAGAVPVSVADEEVRRLAKAGAGKIETAKPVAKPVAPPVQPPLQLPVQPLVQPPVHPPVPVQPPVQLPVQPAVPVQPPVQLPVQPPVPAQTPGQLPQRPRAPTFERSRDKSFEESREPSFEQSREQSFEQSREQSFKQSPGQSPEQSNQALPSQGGFLARANSSRTPRALNEEQEPVLSATVLLASLKKVDATELATARPERTGFKPLDFKPFDKARKVSNIVNLFEKTGPKATDPPPEPIRTASTSPARRLKLSRVGEQPEHD